MWAGLGYGSFSSSPRNPRHSQKPSLKQFLNQLAYFCQFSHILPVCRLQFWVPWHPRSKRYKLRWGRVGTGENSAQIQQQFCHKRVCSESNHAGKESNVMAMPSCRGSMRSHHWGSIWSSLHAWFAQFLWHCHNRHKKHNQCFCVSKSALANKAISIWGRFCLVVPPFIASLSLVLPPWWLMPILPSRSLPRGEFLYVSYAAGLSFIHLFICWIFRSAEISKLWYGTWFGMSHWSKFSDMRQLSSFRRCVLEKDDFSAQSLLMKGRLWCHRVITVIWDLQWIVATSHDFTNWEVGEIPWSWHQCQGWATGEIRGAFTHRAPLISMTNLDGLNSLNTFSYLSYPFLLNFIVHVCSRMLKVSN